MQLHRVMDDLGATGFELSVIGNGLPSFIEGFREKTGFTGPLYTDPGRRTYQALELRRDLLSSLNLKSLRRARQAHAAGNRQSHLKALGDSWQQGGVFVIDANGEILYGYASEFAGDHPPVDDLVRECREARR